MINITIRICGEIFVLNPFSYFSHWVGTPSKTTKRIFFPLRGGPPGTSLAEKIH